VGRWASPGHIAVVPVRGLDRQTEQALQYAGKLSARVLAIHVQEHGNPSEQLEILWARTASDIPLLVIDAPAREWRHRFMLALEVLRRTEQADLITVVIPRQPTRAPHGRHAALAGTDSLRLALSLMSGVVVSDCDGGQRP
jgi:hypothetical protein